MRPIALVYLALIAAEWGLVYFVSRRASLRELIGARRNPLVEVALAAGIWIVWQLFTLAWARALGPGASHIGGMLPRGPLEIALWIVLSTSAGFAEELFFRGYLQRRFGLIPQAVIFGIVHGYQGVSACVRITIYGLLFGLAAKRLRSLVPGMIAHAWTDIAAGIFRL